MMKLILTLALTFTLYSSAGALSCQTCLSLSCGSPTSVTCDSETSCVTGSLNVKLGTSLQLAGKSCATSVLCPSTGKQTYSFNTSTYHLLADVECCNTDDCNTGMIPVLTTQATNSLTCCTDSDCNGTVICRGNEDRCFLADVSVITDTVYGCASNNLCTFLETSNSLPLLGSLGTLNVTCCEGNSCNAAVSMMATTTVSMMANAAVSVMANAWLLRLSWIHLLLAVYHFW